MANYIARVELHGATDEEDYEELHENMEQRGYSRTILGGDGIRYQLPDATYVMENVDDVSLDQAHAAAVEAAGETGFEFSLIVADWNDAKFTNLEPALP